MHNLATKLARCQRERPPCRISPETVSLRLIIRSPNAKLAEALGVEEDFEAFCAGRGKADIDALLAEHAKVMRNHERAAVGLPPER